MKKEFRAHPLMILSLVKPYLFILVLPVLKGFVQYVLYKKITGVLTLEIIGFIFITTIAAMRCRSFRLICGKNYVIVRMGLFFVKKSVIKVSHLSSVQTVQNPVDAVFRAVTYRINTEAGSKNKADFEFKLSQRDSAQVSDILYGKKKSTAVKFSVFKVALMAATTSSAVTGMIIAVPIINRTGNLLGLALSDMLFDEINNVSSKIQTYFPPVVNTITLVFLTGYAISFVYSLLKYINFKLFLETDKLEVRSGFFVRVRTAFKKSSVNNVKIDQTPLMRIFKRYAMKVSIGGYGDKKSESAVIVPSGRRGDIKHQFSIYFPFLEPDGKLIHAKRDSITRARFLFWPAVLFIVLIVISLVTSLIFSRFLRVILFLTLIAGFVIIYYAYLCLFEYRLGKLRLGDNILAQGAKKFRTTELYCPKENVGEVKIIRYLPDIRQKSCNVVITVRSEIADSITVRHLDYETVKKNIYKCFDITE